MLINKNSAHPQKDEITVVKLTSGEEIIATVSDINEIHISLYRPCTLGIGQGGHPVMNKWMVFADKDKPVEIKTSSIVAFATPDSDMAAHYTTLTSNIVTAPAGLVTR